MLELTNYKEQLKSWPDEGQHIMAQYDDKSVTVYQAYRPSIGLFAAQNQYFGGAFKYTRMSWIKPNFLWMMYRCGWASKQGQEVVLAIRLKRSYFNKILAAAYPSSCPSNWNSDTWKAKIRSTNVRLQWDPDHDPFGNKVKRRAIQLGLRNDFLEPFRGDGIVEVEDISSFVREQGKLVGQHQLDDLVTPREAVYPVSSDIALSLGMENDNKNSEKVLSNGSAQE